MKGATYVERSCKSKIRYATEIGARKAARNQRQLYGEPAIAEYECRFCGGWHTGYRIDSLSAKLLTDPSKPRVVPAFTPAYTTPTIIDSNRELVFEEIAHLESYLQRKYGQAFENPDWKPKPKAIKLMRRLATMYEMMLDTESHE